MYEYVKCPTCNKSLGEFYKLFIAMKSFKSKQNIKKEHTAPNQYEIDLDINEDILDIFKHLHITRTCCKTKLLTVKRLSDTFYEDYNY